MSESSKYTSTEVSVLFSNFVKLSNFQTYSILHNDAALTEL